MAVQKCSFCGRPKNEVRSFVEANTDQEEASGPRICDRCIETAFQAVQAGQKGPKTAAAKPKDPIRKPKQIKEFLDEYVISQDRAKIDISVAIYDHYKRRDAVSKKMQEVEVEKANILLLGPTGCHRKGQLVLMYDGTFKAVEDVQVGDQLMGPDSTPRNVLELHRGTEAMVEIVPLKGDPWVVNEGHILTLVRTFYNGGSGYRPANEVKDVPLRDWMSWSRSHKHAHKLFRVPVDFSGAADRKLPLDPYFLGVLLGDGSLGATPRVTTEDDEILAVVKDQAARFELGVVKYQYDEAKCPSYAMCRADRGGDTTTDARINPIAMRLAELDLLEVTSADKFIPQSYKTASREDRLAVLAGLIDTDGSLDEAGVGYNFISKSKQLVEDLAFIARSLGFAAYPEACTKRCQTGAEGTYYRMFISGDVSRIPVKIPRKKAPVRSEDAKNVLRTGFTTRPLPPEEYFGFVLDGDHRYLLDDFTVTHNTGKTHIARTIAKMLNVPFYNGDATRLTQAGYVGDDVESLLQGLVQDAGGDIERAEWGIIYLDEIDKIARSSGRERAGYRDVSGEGVQQALLKLLEGSRVAIARQGGKAMPGMTAMDTIDTKNILFICAGSFAGIEDVVRRRVAGKGPLGFGAPERKKVTDVELYAQVNEQDILDFGIIPEMKGRLPVLTSTYELSEEDMVKVLVEPKNSIIKQAQFLFSLDNVDLQFEPEALRAIAREAKKQPMGARALRSIVEKTTAKLKYEIPSDSTIETVIITERAVTGEGEAMIKRRTEESEPPQAAQA